MGDRCGWLQHGKLLWPDDAHKLAWWNTHKHTGEEAGGGKSETKHKEKHAHGQVNQQKLPDHDISAKMKSIDFI